MFWSFVDDDDDDVVYCVSCIVDKKDWTVRYSATGDHAQNPHHSPPLPRSSSLDNDDDDQNIENV
jgi:hypothetical protein